MTSEGSPPRPPGSWRQSSGASIARSSGIVRRSRPVRPFSWTTRRSPSSRTALRRGRRGRRAGRPEPRARGRGAAVCGAGVGGGGGGGAAGAPGAEGLRAGLFRPISLWPFLDLEVGKLADQVKAVVVAEMNLGQMVYEVERAAHGKTRVVAYQKASGEPVHPEEILAVLREGG